MLKLHSIARFAEDLERYKSTAEKISQPAAKSQMNNLIVQFERYASLINESHSSYANGFIKPKQQKEYITEMASLRLRLEKFVRDAG